ncbi:MAG: serine--tRNA ligase [Bacillota bacterium]
MLDIKFIVNNPDVVKKAVRDKNMEVDIDRLLSVYEDVRAVTSQVDSLRGERNSLSREIPKLQGEEKEKGIARVRDLKDEIGELEGKLAALREEYEELMLLVPSVPRPEVPVGKGEEDNVEIRRVGEIPKFDFEFKDHLELAEALGIVDIPRAVNIAGSRSYMLKNEGALLELAVTRFVLDRLWAKGFQLLTVPVLVRERAMTGTGYFPLGRDQAYAVPEDELFLVGTSEVSLVSYHQDEILSYRDLPRRYTALSTCFRREAGTYGKDTRGLYRVHQFQKVEQVIFCEADDEVAEKLHYELLNNAEEILQALELPYRVCLACTGEIGAGQVRKHEVETWMPSRNAYSETHSCSTLNDYQSRRLNIKYRDADGKSKYCYTLNNTAIASPRILIPLLENHQNADGSVNIPPVLRTYMNGLVKLVPQKR